MPLICFKALFQAAAFPGHIGLVEAAAGTCDRTLYGWLSLRARAFLTAQEEEQERQEGPKYLHLHPSWFIDAEFKMQTMMLRCTGTSQKDALEKPTARTHHKQLVRKPRIKDNKNKRGAE